MLSIERDVIKVVDWGKEGRGYEIIDLCDILDKIDYDLTEEDFRKELSNIDNKYVINNTLDFFQLLKNNIVINGNYVLNNNGYEYECVSNRYENYIFELNLKFIIEDDKNSIDLQNIIFKHCDFSNTGFDKINMYGINFYKTGMVICKNLNMENIFLNCNTELNLTSCNIYHLTMHGTIWLYVYGCNIRKSRFTCAHINGFIESSNLDDVNFGGSCIKCKFVNCVMNNIEYDEHTGFFALQCPEEGSFIGFKKCNIDINDEYYESVIVKLLIPEDALRSSATSRKCRCSKAKVLSITSLDGEIRYDEAHSKVDSNFKYKVGEVVEPDCRFDTNRWEECASGIHFFVTRGEAIQYNF